MVLVLVCISCGVCVERQTPRKLYARAPSGGQVRSILHGWWPSRRVVRGCGWWLSSSVAGREQQRLYGEHRPGRWVVDLSRVGGCIMVLGDLDDAPVSKDQEGGG